LIVVAVIALVFTLVNMIIRPIVKVLTFPLYIITLGLFFIVVNALMLLLTSKVTDSFNYGLHIEGFGSAVLGSLIVSLISTIVIAILPDRRSRRRCSLAADLPGDLRSEPEGLHLPLGNHRFEPGSGVGKVGMVIGELCRFDVVREVVAVHGADPGGRLRGAGLPEGAIHPGHSRFRLPFHAVETGDEVFGVFEGDDVGVGADVVPVDGAPRGDDQGDVELRSHPRVVREHAAGDTAM